MKPSRQVMLEPKTPQPSIAEAGVRFHPRLFRFLLKAESKPVTVLKGGCKVKGKGTQRGYVLAEVVSRIGP